MAIPAELEEKIYDKYMRIHRVERVPLHATNAVDYLNEHAMMYAEKVPRPTIDIDRYCFGILCFDTLSHRNKFYRDYPDVAFILEDIEEEYPFTYRYVKFDMLACCIYRDVVITRYIRSVSKAVAGFFDRSNDDWERGMVNWATETALGVWDEISPDECEKVGGSFVHDVCPDERDRGFNDGIFIVSYSEVGHKKNVIGRYVCDKGDRPKIMSGENVYTGTLTQDRWNRV